MRMGAMAALRANWGKLLGGAVIAGSLSACVSTAPVDVASHEEAYLIDCSGLGQSVGDCMEQAREVCPDGYQVISTTGADKWGSGREGAASLLEEMDRGVLIGCQ